MSVVPSQPLPPRRLTVDQYHQLTRCGFLSEDDPVELLEGVLVLKIPKSIRHVTSAKLTRQAIQRLLPDQWHYMAQNPVTLGDGEPEPDGAVVRGGIEDYAAAHPGPSDVPLVIEVADTSLARDRGIKLRSYARAAIRTYWIINLIERQVEVYQEPDADALPEPYYRRRDVFLIGQHVPLELGVMTVAEIAVVDLLPPA